MQKLKQTGIALIVAGLLSANAYAGEAAVEQVTAQPVAAFTDVDLNALFGQEAGKPMQLAALSGQEMRETEGALGLAGAALGGLWGGGSQIMNNIGQRRPINQWNWSLLQNSSPERSDG